MSQSGTVPDRLEARPTVVSLASVISWARTLPAHPLAATGDGRTPEIGAPQARFDELLLGVLTAPIELAIQF
jgi:hypothetical protein